jgi:hypothetical protein
MCFRSLLGKRRERKYMEFLIHNWDGANAMNPSAVPDLDAAMAGAGAIPVGGEDSPDGVIYRVEVMRDDLERQELLEILKGLGFEVDVVGEEKLER